MFFVQKVMFLKHNFKVILKKLPLKLFSKHFKKVTLNIPFTKHNFKTLYKKVTLKIPFTKHNFKHMF